MTRRVWHSHICLVLVLGRTALLPVVAGRADPWSTMPNRWSWFLTSELLCRKQRETTALLSPVQTVIMNLNNKTMNSVNGTITTGNGASLGRKLYEPQVHSDRHLATATKSLHTGTRNVRSARAIREHQRRNGYKENWYIRNFIKLAGLIMENFHQTRNILLWWWGTCLHVGLSQIK